MVQGYYPLIQALSEDLDIRLNCRYAQPPNFISKISPSESCAARSMALSLISADVGLVREARTTPFSFKWFQPFSAISTRGVSICRVKRIVRRCNQVLLTVEGGEIFVADAVIVTVPVGVLKVNSIRFEPELPEWKRSAISDIGVGNENKIALRFNAVFWPNVEFLGVVAPTSHACGYFLNLHKASGHPVLVFMAAGTLAGDMEKLSDDEAAQFAMLQLKKMFADAADPVSQRALSTSRRWPETHG